jgi:F-type H+-transporting ATPase subunit b
LIAHSRFSTFVFRLVLLAALFVAAVISAQLTAQESAPVSTQTSAPVAQSTEQTAAASPTEAKPAGEAKAAQTEEEQKNVFRLEGPIVKWTAKTFNLSLGTTANIFDFINFGIIVLLIGVPLIKVLPKLLRGRGEKVRADLESARKATEEANARLSAIEAKLAGLGGEIEAIRAQVEAESQADEMRIKSSIQEESARIVVAAEQEISSSAAQARRSLRNFAADLAITQAAQQLKLTPETDSALIAEFLGDAGLQVSAKGGQK